MSPPVPFTMQLRSATARQSEKLVHHHEHITTNGRRALKVYFNDAPGNPEFLTLFHQPRSEKLVHHHEHININIKGRRALKIHFNDAPGNPQSLTLLHHQHRSGLKLKLGKLTPKNTTEAKKVVLHHHEHLTVDGRRALRIYMSNGKGKLRTKTIIDRPTPGLRLSFDRPVGLAYLSMHFSQEQTRLIRSWVDKNHRCTNVLDDAVISAKADLLIAAAGDQQMNGDEIKVEDVDGGEIKVEDVER